VEPVVDVGGDHISSAAGGRDHEPQAARGAATVAASVVQVSGRGATADGSGTTTDAGCPGTTVALGAHALDSAALPRASPVAQSNGRPRRRELKVINELDVWEEAPVPVEPLDPAEEEVRTVERHVGLDLVIYDPKEAAAA
jgi:hypothetical protein